MPWTQNARSSAVGSSDGLRPDCAVILSHPRSGTHLLLDFLRRNFPIFRFPLPVWASARELYLNLDEGSPETHNSWIAEYDRPCILAHSHCLGVTRNLHDLNHVFATRRPVFLYPFRRYSSTARSYINFLLHTRRVSGEGTITQFLDKTDPYFGTGLPIATCLARHAEQSLGLRPRLIDVDHLLADPEPWARRIADILKTEPIPTERRIPLRKRFSGKLAEGYQRLRSRESTEVQIPTRIGWHSEEEARNIDRNFGELYNRLREGANA